MAKERKTICVSSSISNWRDKLVTRCNLPEWGLRDLFSPVIFFGMYNVVDYLRFVIHQGSKTVFWCGSDILNLEKRPWWQDVFSELEARHICENAMEESALFHMDIDAEIHPMIFEEIHLEPYFMTSPTPHVYLCAHPGSLKEYGVDTVLRIHRRCPEVTFHIYGVDGESQENVIFHGKIPNEQFNEEIRSYQGALRLNEFDGFSEVLAKSVLLGQYPISRIPYQYIETFSSDDELVKKLCQLKSKMKENYTASNWWKFRLNKSLEVILG